jgi:hypothetical protein
MTKYYNNVPQQIPSLANDSAIQTFNQYFNGPIELNNSELMAVTAFFEKRGFDTDSAQSTAVILMQQAYKDSVSIMPILDTLTGLNRTQLSDLVGEILNYNRLNTSSLGVSKQSVTPDFITRNIIA